MVDKKLGGFRAIIDLKRLNLHVSCPHFKMETTQSILKSLRQGYLVICFDLSDAYLQIPIHAKSQHLLRFVVDGKVFQYTALCFGLSPSPLMFTKVMKPIAAYLWSRGIHIHLYLDDWLIRAESKEKVLQDAQVVLNLISDLGLLLNVEKSTLFRTQNLVYFGGGYRS